MHSKFLEVINFKNTPDEVRSYPVLIAMPTTHSRVRKFFSNVVGHVRRPCISSDSQNDNKVVSVQPSLQTPAVGMFFEL